MAKMGYKEGMGLGKFNQGRTSIIEQSKQRGRRGLGVKVAPELQNTDQNWDFEHDIAEAEETVKWIPESDKKIPSFKVLKTWIKEGKKKETIDDEDEYCDSGVLEQVLKAKTVLDSMEGDELRKARTRSNPYETIRGVFFLNRAAMKMANIDAVFDFMFTNSHNEDDEKEVSSDDLLYFADVCAGPGGFSEYVLWRKKWKAKGFGFTLKGANDFKLEDFFAGPCETFEAHYGEKGSEGDGDVFKTENQLAFRNFVLNATNDKGVHFMMADGGFSVEGQENIQEILSKQLYLCQFLVALSIVRTGGHFACKLFDLFTPFSVGLIYLMYLCFKQVCICKPVTSRPANSERYIVCKGKREDSDEVYQYFDLINKLLPTQWDKDQDIIHIVPPEIIQKDTKFYEYIITSNNELAQIQIRNLKKIHTFYSNPSLHEHRQSDLRKKCLELWQIPDKVRSAPKRQDPATFFKQITKNESSDYMNGAAGILNKKSLETIGCVYEYRCLVSGGRISSKEDFAFILSLGRSHVYHWDGCGKMEWKKLNLPNQTVELPRGTLVFAELINELQGESRGQKKVRALHILDAFSLGEDNVSLLPYDERMAKGKLFAHAVSKTSKSEYMAVRVKKIYGLQDIEEIFKEFEMHVVKGQLGGDRLCYPCDNGRFFVPFGCFIFKIVQDPWMLAFSKTRNQIYFHSKHKQSTFEAPKGAYADFRSTFKSRLLWNWEEDNFLGTNNSAKTLSKQDVIKHIRSKMIA
ncbi:FtsJ methyltransferase domain-containing protein 2, variant 2 [Chamberlinius hualienensis]